MPWIVGIDEAGYGPNLGPLVMSSVACRVPEGMIGADFWSSLAGSVRRDGEPRDYRILVGDSKRVYSPARGLKDLETGVLAVLLSPDASPILSVRDYLRGVSPAALDVLGGEVWFDGHWTLPVEADADSLRTAAVRFHETSGNSQVQWGPVRSVVMCPARFNEEVDRHGSKGAVLGLILAELLAINRGIHDEAEAVFYTVDKHGGRNNYAAVLQHATAGEMVIANEEGPARSVYTVSTGERVVRFTFQPRADAEHFCVALASMASKYLRELLMRDFNRFWQGLVPGLKATAGYPGDSTRFFDAILPAARQLNLAPDSLWRRR